MTTHTQATAPVHRVTGRSRRPRSSLRSDRTGPGDARRGARGAPLARPRTLRPSLAAAPHRAALWGAPLPAMRRARGGRDLPHAPLCCRVGGRAPLVALDTRPRDDVP